MHLTDFVAGLAIGGLVSIAALLLVPAIERKTNRSRYGRRRRWLP